MEWTDMSTAPRDGTYFMAWVENDKYTGPLAVYRHNLNHWASCGEGFNADSLLGWAPMPDKPVKKHHCSVNDVSCYTDQNGTLFLKTFSQVGRHVLYSVKFCPFCGEEGEK